MTAQPSGLQALQDRYGEALEREISSWVSRLGAEGAFPGMLRYQLGYVDENLEQVASRGGKRFRPLLHLATCDAAGGSWERALPVAAAIELLHNFSLIHDDIEDHDPARRHRATVWKVWGEPQAINAGDAMHALASRAVMDVAVDPAVVLQLARAFQDTAVSLTTGQYLDMSFESRQDVRTEEYLEMISLKTGAIIVFSVWSGALIAGAGEAALRSVRAFGQHLGAAFQIADDIQGIWGLPERTGKEAASDLRNRKKTLPVLIALERASGAEQEALRRFYRSEDNDLSAVLETLESTEARSAAKESVAQHLEAAHTELGKAGLPVEARHELLDLAADLTGQREARS